MKRNLPESRGDIMFNPDKTNPKDLLGVKKVPVNLIPPVAIIQEAMAMKFGAYLTKRADGTTGYGPYNWREGQIQLSIYLAAIMRHWLAYLDGEDLASDSGIHHLAHIRAGCGIVLDAIANGNLIDDRPTKGKASQLLEAFKEVNEQS